MNIFIGIFYVVNIRTSIKRREGYKNPENKILDRKMFRNVKVPDRHTSDGNVPESKNPDRKISENYSTNSKMSERKNLESKTLYTYTRSCIPDRKILDSKNPIR